MLWALVRRERRVRNAAPEEARIKVTTVRMTGAAIAVAAVAMLFIAIQDGRGHRARFKVETALGSGDTESAIRHADSAAAWALDPFHNVAARMFAVWACSADFDRRLIGNAVPFDSDMRVAEDALVRLKSIEDDAPRFLRLSILRSELCMNVARAYQRRNEPKYQADFEHRRNAAFTQRLADDPFEFDNLAAVWVARSEAGSMERLAWLRGLLRSGEMDPRVIELFRSMAALPDFLPALNDLFNLATADQARPVDSWQDRLTPETFRLAALARALNRQHGDAVRFAETADELYTRAGPRLFAPHAAAIHERVRYAFAQDPKADPDEALVQLARANTKMTGPSSADQPLPAPMGYTRLNILLAAGREDEARVELAALPFDASTAQDADARLSAAYVGLAAQFASDRARVPLALGWVRRALELDADSLDAHVTLADIQLRQSDIEPAVATLRRIAAVAPDKATADSRLNLLQARHPDSAAWKELGRASPAATQPEGR
jgi:tetratricopeptide (TPR) repeat protein